MSRQRRNFSAKFKSDLIIELLKGGKDLNTLAVENNIQPNLLRCQTAHCGRHKLNFDFGDNISAAWRQIVVALFEEQHSCF